MLFVGRRRERRRRVFDDSLPVMEAGHQQTATNDGNDGYNDTHETLSLATTASFKSPVAESLPERWQKGIAQIIAAGLSLHVVAPYLRQLPLEFVPGFWRDPPKAIVASLRQGDDGGDTGRESFPCKRGLP